MYEFYYDYLLPKYQASLKLCYMDAYSFIIDIRTDEKKSVDNISILVI